MRTANKLHSFIACNFTRTFFYSFILFLSSSLNHLTIMAVSGIDLGATKLSLAVFSEEGKILHKETIALNNRTGKQVGELIATAIKELLTHQNVVGNIIRSIGIAV